MASERDEDEDLRRESIDQRLALRRLHTCQCGDDLPGSCPGPMNCPYSDFAGDDDGASEGTGHGE